MITAALNCSTLSNVVAFASGAASSDPMAAARDQQLAFSKRAFAAQLTIGGAVLKPGTLPAIHLGPVVSGPMIVGTPRTQLTVPVSPVIEPNDQTLFEQADDSNEKLYLARCRVAQQNRLWSITASYGIAAETG